jgi:AsmA protein
MRKLLVGILGVLLVALGLVLAVIFVPSPLQKWAVERGASFATGRAVTLGEPFRLRVWPPVEIIAGEVRIANAEWGTAPELAGIGTLEAKLDLLAYWNEGRVQLDRLVVTRPEINLEVAPDGRRNWELGGSAAGGASAPAGSGAGIPPFVLGEVRIADGTVAYDDRASGTSKRAEAVELVVTQAGRDQPVAIEGGLTVDGQRATLTGRVDRLQGAAAGESSPIRLALGLPGATASFEGEIETGAPSAVGAVAIEIAAPRELLAWVGVPPPDGLPEPLALRSRVELAGDRIALSALEAQAARIQAAGEIAVALIEPPKVTGGLALGRLDLSPYLRPGPTNGAPGQQDAVWPDTSMELPLPLPVDLDVRVRGESVTAGKVEIGAFAARVEADRRQAVLSVEELRAYGGGLTGRAKIEPGAPPAYSLDLDVDGIGLLAASQALTGLSRFDGSAQARLALTSRGASVKDLVGQLEGDGKILLRDGAVIGINIAGMLRQIMTLGLNPGAVRQQRTDFAEAGGSFRIADGILRTNDLALRAPVLRLAGAGTVDLPRQWLDLRIVPRLASTLQGQDARGEPAFQAGLPFVVQGPYASPSVRFDLNGTLTSAVSSPADFAKLATDLASSPEAVQVIRKQFDFLGDLPVPAAGKALEAARGALGGGKGGQGSDLGKAARGLLEGLSGR